jgi:hypothetical protein
LQFARTGVAIYFDLSLNGSRKSIRLPAGKDFLGEKRQFFQIVDEAKDHAVEAAACNPGQFGSDDALAAHRWRDSLTIWVEAKKPLQFGGEGGIRTLGTR